MLCSFFFSYGNANTKKEALIVEFPLTLYPIWLLRNIFLLFYSLKIPLLATLLNYGTSIMPKNGIPSPPSGMVFNIAQ
jgi:hypothetical protein